MIDLVKKLLILCWVAGVVVAANAAEVVWDFESLQNVAPPSWAPKSPTGHVSEAEDIACENGSLTFTSKKPHCYFWLNFAETVEGTAFDAKQFHFLKIRFQSPAPGKITLFYSSPDGEMANMDSAIEVVEGWNEYEIDLQDMTFGREVHSPEGKNYERWGGDLQQVKGLRIDTWFPADTTVKFDYIKLSDEKVGQK